MGGSPRHRDDYFRRCCDRPSPFRHPGLNSNLWLGIYRSRNCPSDLCLSRQRGRPRHLEGDIRAFVLPGRIFVLTHLIEGVFTLTLVVGITIFLQGIIQVVMSFQTRRVSPRWIWMLISGLIGIVLGIYIWSQLSSTAPWLIGTLVGINLLFDGIWMLTLHSGGRRTLTEQ